MAATITRNVKNIVLFILVQLVKIKIVPLVSTQCHQHFVVLTVYIDGYGFGSRNVEGEILYAARIHICNRFGDCQYSRKTCGN